MLVALIARDMPGKIELRRENRAAHLDYIEETGIVTHAGPLIVDDEMAGSLVILEVETMEQAQDWADNDPYTRAGLFESVNLIEWKKVIG